MKARITRIENGIVYCKTVNPLGEKEYNWAGSQAPISYWDNLAKWQQAESERKELPLDNSSVIFHKSDIYIAGFNMRKCYVGDIIEVIEQDNKFKIAEAST